MRQIPGAAVHAAAAVVTITIIILSLLPHLPKEMNPFTYSDKVFHALMYLVFSMLLFFSLKTRFSEMKNHAAAAIIIVLFFGGIIELIQPLFSRSKDIYDFISDAAGGSAGIFLSRYLIRIFRITFSRKGISFGE